MHPNAVVRLRLWLGGLAAAGVILAHQLAYLVASPDPHERAELLRAAGHRDWSLVIALAVGALIAGLAGFVRRGLRGATESPTWSVLARRLAALQGAAFLLLEGAERGFVGGDPAVIFGEPVVFLGLLLQAIVALIGAGLANLLGRALKRWVVRRSRPRRAARRVSFPRLAPSSPSFLVCTGSGDLRGPPRRL